MNTRTEPNVTTGFFPFQVQISRAFELSFISIGGCVTNIDHGSFGNQNAVHFDIIRRHSKQSLHWAFQANYLFTKGPQVLIGV